MRHHTNLLDDCVLVVYCGCTLVACFDRPLGLRPRALSKQRVQPVDHAPPSSNMYMYLNSTDVLIHLYMYLHSFREYNNLVYSYTFLKSEYESALVRISCVYTCITSKKKHNWKRAHVYYRDCTGTEDKTRMYSRPHVVPDA